jgi:hypothetical protein
MTDDIDNPEESDEDDDLEVANDEVIDDGIVVLDSVEPDSSVDNEGGE